MFTGIIEEVGVVTKLVGSSSGAMITVSCKKVLEDLRVGDSVAVNGVCLTARDVGNDFFVADVMPETFRSTALSELSAGKRVNLERALKAGGRFGGHIVLGHVDGVGKILKSHPEGNAVVIEIGAPLELMEYVVPKGSVAVDGISLTVQGVKKHGFMISIIPHTLRATALQYKKPGDKVNLETDIIGKYVREFLLTMRESDSGKGLTAEMLKFYGF
ncbi:riboflavin synthase [Thermosediminibacter oceani]|uniref:Riboflavin synthase n=1 Tax=Thermosediminibacter oceani (strain ATCC BAA-1034 / DSM 16646 / JW/IW-1228P) TaxID=555079 RepID=D9RYK6_THEOJ|nr:riboflavin synthase [Thermosediminibacter oceani]ADL08430.1 riboflavin synthase, alpha subunit [Thermosediminibacter oceani DSM 16646]